MACAPAAQAVSGKPTESCADRDAHPRAARGRLELRVCERLLGSRQCELDERIGADEPIYLNAGMNGLGPRVEESGIGTISGYLWSAPYEDVRLKAR